MPAEVLELHLSNELTSPYEVAEGVLRAGPEHWLPGFEQEGDRMLFRLALPQGGGRVGRRVTVQVGTVQRFGYGVTVHVEWQAARNPKLYPHLEGHLRAERADDGHCHLRFDARYTPPAGALGASADRALLQRVAHGTVDGFFASVGQRLASPVPS
jgi:hypothetical protein